MERRSRARAWGCIVSLPNRASLCFNAFLPWALGLLLGVGVCFDVRAADFYLNLNRVSDDVRASIEDAYQYGSQPQASKNGLASRYEHLVGKGLPAELDLEIRLAAASLYSQAAEDEQPMPGEAIRVYESAIRAYPQLELDPRILNAEVNLGNLYLIDNRDVSQAEELFKYVLNVNEEEFVRRSGAVGSTAKERQKEALREVQAAAARSVISHRLSFRSEQPSDQLNGLETLRAEWPQHTVFQKEVELETTRQQELKKLRLQEDVGQSMQKEIREMINDIH
jgi:tetratricopeptide (TPR) repeat protein